MTRAEIQRGGVLHARGTRTGGPFYTLACANCGTKVIAEIDSAGRIRLSGKNELHTRPRMRAILDFFLGPPAQRDEPSRSKAKPNSAASAKSQNGRSPTRKPIPESKPRATLFTPIARELISKLEIEHCATIEEIRREYRRFVREQHPDRFANQPSQERERADRMFRERHQQFQALLKHLASRARKA